MGGNNNFKKSVFFFISGVKHVSIFDLFIYSLINNNWLIFLLYLHKEKLIYLHFDGINHQVNPVLKMILYYPAFYVIFIFFKSKKKKKFIKQNEKHETLTICFVFKYKITVNN